MESKIKQGRIAILLLAIVCVVSGDNVAKNDTKREDLGRSLLNRQSRGIAPYMGLISCAMKYDVSCFVDAAENYLEVERTQLLAEADAQAALQSSGRSNSEDKPSHIANTLSRLISELTSMFQNGISGFFKQGKDLDDEDEEGEESDEGDSNQLTTATDGSVGAQSRATQRHKKHNHEGLIKKIIRVVKMALYVIILLAAQVSVVVLFNSFVGFKMLLVTMWGVAFLALKVWLLHKKEGTVVVHEDVHHDHHYENDEHHHYDHIPVDDWQRIYLPKSSDREYAQKIAYSKQKQDGSIWSSWLD
ncbi:uncharacterized protein [Euwallacea fornicatus]|uniref:uncharacterized protein isoform X1 n=1 Tax=Euwallacea fornicatus TaxID=995702 RepID=UPI00339071D4